MPGSLDRARTGRPEAAFLTAVSGAILLVEGFYLITGSGTPSYASVSVSQAGFLSSALGLGILVLAFAFWTKPQFRSSVGTTTILLSAVDFWFGGGFLVGSLLGLIGGLLMILLPGSEAA